MPEAELVSHVYSSQEAIWSLLQYWTSVSMGVLIGAHFVASRLNRLVIAFFLVIYISFSIQIYSIIAAHMQILQGIAMDLQQLADGGISLSNSSRSWLENSPTVNDSPWLKLNGLLMNLAMFVATISYPIYCKRKVSD
jgi:hypothetical protein